MVIPPWKGWREDHLRAPYSPYGVTKLAAEQLCSLYAENFGIRAISLRLFTVFGPRQRPRHVFSNLISAALTGRPFILHGGWHDAAGFYVCLRRGGRIKLAADAPIDRGTFNIAGGQAISMNAAIGMVEDIAGTRISIERRSEKKGDVRRTAADISEAGRRLGFHPHRNLRDGLREQIEFHRQAVGVEYGAVGASLLKSAVRADLIIITKEPEWTYVRRSSYHGCHTRAQRAGSDCFPD